MTKTNSALLFSSICLALSACGGGGGGSGSNDDPTVKPLPASPSGVTITTANSKRVANVATSLLPLNSGHTALDTQIFGVAVESHPIFALGDFSRNRLLDLLGSPVTSAQVAGAISTETIFCIPNDSSSGTLTQEIDDADDNKEVSVGDSLTLTYTNCRLSSYSSERISGSVKTKITGYDLSNSGGNSLMVVKADFLFQQLQVIGDRPITENGPMTLEYTREQSATTDRSITRVNMAGLTQSGLFGNDTVNSGSYVQTIDNKTNTYSISGNGAVTNNLLGGLLTFTTPTALTGVGTSPPTKGSLKIIGANGALIVSPVSSTEVQLGIDIGDNSTIDSTQTVSWFDI